MRVALASTLFEAITAAGNGDDLRVVKKAVEDGAGCRNIVEQFAPFFDRTIGGHHGGTVFVTAHDNFEEDFSTLRGKDFQPHVVDNEQIGFKIFFQEAAFGGLSWVEEKFTHQIKDGAIKDEEAGFDRFLSDGLSEMAFADSGRSHQKHVAALTNKVTSSELVNLGAVD